MYIPQRRMLPFKRPGHKGSCSSLSTFLKDKRSTLFIMIFWFILILIRDHSYITSSHFWDFWTPLPPYVSMFLVLRISKNWHFHGVGIGPLSKILAVKVLQSVSNLYNTIIYFGILRSILISIGTFDL